MFKNGKKQCLFKLRKYAFNMIKFILNLHLIEMYRFMSVYYALNLLDLNEILVFMRCIHAIHSLSLY